MSKKSALFSDPDVLMVAMGRSWSILAGVVSAAAVAHLMTPVQQGYYYTFLGITAAQVLFEMGLNHTVSQFVAHEMVEIRWTSSGSLRGARLPMGRLGSIVRRMFSIVGLAAVFFGFFGFLGGFVMFSLRGELPPDDWTIPWIAVIGIAAIKMGSTALEAVLEGMGRVRYVALIRLLAGIAMLPVLLAGLALGFGLYAVALGALANLLVLVVGHWVRYRRAVVQLLRAPTVKPFNWRMEVWPVQWRIAVSWVSGYFVFNLYTPAIFLLAGPELAGKFGLGLAVTGAVASLAASWINAKVPMVCSQIALRDVRGVVRTLEEMARNATIIAMCGSLTVLIAWFAASVWYPSILDRMLQLGALVILLSTALLSQYCNAVAAVARAHKEEPFLIVSVGSAVVTTFSLLLLTPKYGDIGAASAGILPVLLLGLPFAKRYKRKILLSRIPV